MTINNKQQILRMIFTPKELAKLTACVSTTTGQYIDKGERYEELDVLLNTLKDAIYSDESS